MGDVLLAYVSGGTARSEFMSSVLEVVRLGQVAEITDLRAGPWLSNARNVVAEHFLKSGREWLWTVDTDIAFTGNTLPALAEVADPETAPVVSALYYIEEQPGGPLMPCAYFTARTTEGDLIFHSIPAGEIPSEPVQVGGVGAGCCLIHRSVFERLAAQRPEDRRLWYSEVVLGGRIFSEDLAFCLRLAACEIPVVLHGGVRVRHYKTMGLGEATP